MEPVDTAGTAEHWDTSYAQGDVTRASAQSVS